MAQRSTFETLCWFIPILGWFVAGLLERRRRVPKCRYIKAQLENRTGAAIADWGEDPRRLAVAEFVSNEIQKEFGWPNAFYVPEDRLGLLFCGCGCDQSVLFVFTEVERRLGVELVYDPATRKLAEMALGQFVDYVMFKTSLRVR